MNDNNIPMSIVVNTQSHDINETQNQPVPMNPFNSKQERGKPSRQVIAAFIANLGTINTGLVFGFSAVVIPQLKLPDSLIKIDDSQVSWIGKFFSKSNIYLYNKRTITVTKTLNLISITTSKTTNMWLGIS